MTINKNDFKGFSLFSDITNITLRTRNRAVVLANMLSDNMGDNQRINARGTSLILGYFLNIPRDEREAVRSQFITMLNQRNIIIEMGV
jgi:hypothetical protein